MKKLFLLPVLFFVLMFKYNIAQTASNPYLQVAFCNVVNDTLKFSDIDKCTELTALDKKYKIKSFKMTIFFPSPKNKNKLELMDQKNIGGKLSSQSFGLIREAKKRGAIKMIIKEVTALNGEKLEGLAGMIIYFSNK